MNTFITAIKDRGWQLKRSLELLSVIESEMLTKDPEFDNEDGE